MGNSLESWLQYPVLDPVCSDGDEESTYEGSDPDGIFGILTKTGVILDLVCGSDVQ